jgi:hypothetical protein
MQYYSSKIHLHRPIANFGSRLSQSVGQSETSRQVCIENAMKIASALQDYRDLYGDATTLSGVSVHIIAAASTILIADIAEKRSPDLPSQYLALKTCVRTLSELEKTYIVARRVRRIIQLVMRLCHLDVENNDIQQELNSVPKDLGNLYGPGPHDYSTSSAFNLGNDESEPLDMLGFSPLCIDELLPVSSQFDIMYSLQHF